MNYWLVKSEPATYSWEDLTKKKEEVWDGIRNFQARNFLKDMRIGDPVLFYHSGKNKEIVGVAQVSREAFPDAGDQEGKGWVAVILQADRALDQPVSLDKIKSDNQLSNLPLLKQSRLSVMPVQKSEFEYVLKLGS